VRVVVDGGTLFWMRLGPVQGGSLCLESLGVVKYGLQEWEFGWEFGERGAVLLKTSVIDLQSK
jgi:hypothetical protein